jgi:hypothetical protein
MTVELSLQRVDVKPGWYCLLYLTKNRSIMGITSKFQVRKYNSC